MNLIIVQKKAIKDSVLGIHQDTDFYITELGLGREIEYQTEPERKMYLIVMAGKISINNKFDLVHRDAAIITFASSRKDTFVNSALSANDVMLIDLAND